uniref:PORR domain-containing protein n=1 Tax=Aegilops tauschii subsp. strangulata TaxID=200361 RepID=A0A453CCA8_AEGTS
IPPVRCISSLKVPWRRDAALDASIDRDRRFHQASRLVREVLLSPGRRLLLRYLSKRRQRIRLPVHVATFLRRFQNYHFIGFLLMCDVYAGLMESLSAIRVV